jgi:hypothetical protein
MHRSCPSKGVREPKASFVALTVEDWARWKCESKQPTDERKEDEHQSFPQQMQAAASPVTRAQTSLVERLQDPLEANVANSLLEPDSLVAGTEPFPLGTPTPLMPPERLRIGTFGE